ncbi:MAG: NUDIX domain-containing protein [Planctomycetota bacterium]
MPFRCSRCRFANFFGPVGAVGGLVIDSEDRLLMVRRARDPGKNQWGLPGGFVDGGESIEQALRREVAEETRLELESFAYLMSGPNQYDYQGVVAPVIDLFFVCRAVDPDAIELERTELNDFVWTKDPGERLENMAFRSNRIAIEFWLDQQAKTE